METIVVFSHLRWDFVYQRPQHLLSRLLEHYDIIFFEEPEYDEKKVELRTSSPMPNLTVCRPVTPVKSPGFHADQMPYLRKMARGLGQDDAAPVVWFYTPMALPLLYEFKPGCVVYDCMDELAAFKNPLPHLLEYEDELLRIADVVFTGGPSLYAAKVHRNPNVHCFPSSVDITHFRQALDRNIAHPDLRDLPRPRIGFFGVIDERIDVELIGEIADSHPEWQLIMVGPVVKIDPATLPRRPNISYMGQQSYNVLPQYLAAWDVCLMPFAMNESTQFISPTKSLEYMAAELPIVSTPVKDVVALHSDVVEIAADAKSFIAAIEHVLARDKNESHRKIRTMRDKVSRTSWTATAQKMHELIQQSDQRQHRIANAGRLQESTSARASRVAGSRKQAG
jgi:UDP-galactopyranose mutase